MIAIRPLHHSIAGRAPRLPNNMERMQVPAEMREGLTNIALSIFADAVNAGQPFQQALLAIYLSGLQHGAAITKESVQ